MEDGGIDYVVRKIRERSNGHCSIHPVIHPVKKIPRKLGINGFMMIIQTFHRANIQNVLTKTETGERGMFMRKIDKTIFLNDQCKEEDPLFLAFGKT